MSAEMRGDTALLELTAEPSGAIETLLEPSADGRLGVARTSGPTRGATGAAAAWLLVEGGHGRLTVGERTIDVAGRDDVFHEPGWSAVLFGRTAFALDDNLRATIVWRASDRIGQARFVDPKDVADERRGEGTTRRRVRTYVGEGPLIVGETLNPPGLWSSYPPHRHEHEEIYLYRFDPPDGFGLQMRSEHDGDEHAVVVRDGRIERITSGWHPVVAAPGSTMYYLWALAGTTDTLETELDTRYV
jgi:5-deoxy-glucuronate isomerase